mgnify:FL=1
MANVKITDLTAIGASDLATTDVLPIVDINNDQTKKVQLDELREFVGYANDFVTYTQLNSNINVVSGNVDAVEANVASIVDTGGHTITFSANGIPSADSTYDLGSASNKWKDLYLSGSSIKLGAITISELGGEGITITGTSGKQANLTTPQLGGVANISANAAQLAAGIAAAGSGGDATDTETRLNANLDIVQDNVTAVESRRDSNVTIQTAIEARRVANVTIMTNEDTALQSRLTTNVTTFTNEDTALQARLTTNVTTFTNEDTALQARIAANTLVAASNDFITFTRLNANVDVVQDNVAAVETRRTANIAGAISTVLTGDLTVSRALASDSSGKISVATTTLAELNHVNGVTSAIQTQRDAVEARRAANNITTTFTDDVIVTGNLTVNGDTTTINTTNMDVDDTMIMLANGTTGSPANDIGILFNRGAQGNAAFFYDESAKTFKLSDTKDPKSNTSLSPITSANLDVGILTVDTVTLNSANLEANLESLAAGIVVAGTSGISKAFPSGDDLDFGVMTGANTTIDAFGVLVGDTYFFDCKTDPTGEITTEDLGALS